MRAISSVSVFVLSCGVVWACGGTTVGQTPAPVDSGAPSDEASVDAGADTAPAVDYGAPSSTYPAFKPNFAQITDNGGPKMKNPVVVSITWNTDSAQAGFDAFADAIGGTAYWKATTSEYGVGAAVSGDANHVHVATMPPAKLADADLQMLVTENAGKTMGWPAPTSDTIYAFFLPPGTSLQTQTFGGGMQDACSAGVGGYHDEVMIAGKAVSYAVVPSCKGGGTPVQESTLSMSHELIEAVTDPNPQSAPALTGFDADHFSFTYFQELQAETGDACEFFRASNFEDKETSPAPFDYFVQRTWSNAGGAAGHDPCVPAAGKVYFNVTPLMQDDVHVTIPGVLTGGASMMQPTKGIKIPAGQSATFPVGFYSDGPTGGPWTISVSKGNPILAGSQGGALIEMYNPSTLTATVDKTSGQNGEKAYVTVSVTSNGTLFDGEIVTVTSTLGTEKHYMPIWIATQ